LVAFEAELADNASALAEAWRALDAKDVARIAGSSIERVLTGAAAVAATAVATAGTGMSRPPGHSE
jgi:hypothetical protein